MEKTGIKIISANRKARHDYFVEETIEAGIELFGTEVKSVRAGTVNLKDSFVSLILLDLTAYTQKYGTRKSVKKTLTIPAWLNKKAVEQNVNFSQILQEGLKRKLFQEL